VDKSSTVGYVLVACILLKPDRLIVNGMQEMLDPLESMVMVTRKILIILDFKKV
jgi:hypothetical protein